MPNTPVSPPNSLQLGPAASLVVYVLGVGALGWGADWVLGSLPWGLITGVIVGFVAWIYMATQAEQG